MARVPVFLHSLLKDPLLKGLREQVDASLDPDPEFSGRVEEVGRDLQLPPGQTWNRSAPLDDFCSTLTMDVTANCICKIHCLALDGFDRNTVHKLYSKEKNLGGT